MDKVQQKFSRFLDDDDAGLKYPDFDAMWSRLERSLPEADAALLPVDMAAPKRKRHRKVAVLSVLAAVLVATPVVAAIGSKWDSIFDHRSGIQSALQKGLGQSIEKSVTHEGVTLTVHTAIVDDNRTVLLYSLSSPSAALGESLQFAKMELQDAQGRVIEGRQSLFWDKESKMWSGYFETEWTPDGVEADVRFTAKNLQSFSRAEHELAFNPFADKKQTFDIRQDGIEQLTLEPFVQGDKLMLVSSVKFDRPEVRGWMFPHIAAYNGDAIIKEAGGGVYGTPGDNGEYTSRQFFPIGDLQKSNVNYKLLYTKEEQRIDKDWMYELRLNKEQMISGTVKRSLNVPLEHAGSRIVLKEMIITPTQIRIKASHEKYAGFPFLNYALEVNGNVLPGGIWYEEGQNNPEETVYRFEVPPGVQVTAQTPITFIAKYENIKHKDAKDPIRLEGISEERQTMTTKVGGYDVKWTYYKRDGNLYVESECADPAFGGVNQTYMRSVGEKGLVGKQVTVNFAGDGNNKAVDMYENYKGTDAELYIYWYYTENPDKELRAGLNE